MRFSPARFNAVLTGDLSQEFAWRRSYACPCITAESGAAKFNCPLCHKKGRIWDAEVVCRAGMTSQTPAKSMAQFGVWEAGDATFTIPAVSPMYAVRQYDRIRAVNATQPFSMSMFHDGNDVLLGTVVSIDRVFWLADDGVTIVEGGIPTVDPTGVLTWTAGEPPGGKAYSISGVKYLEYFCYLPQPTTRNTGVSGLPIKLLGRLFDLFGR